jgi:hypothetical protein
MHDPAAASPFVAGVGTLALINAALARLGGRSALLYFLVSLLLGPFVTLYFVLTFKRPL